MRGEHNGFGEDIYNKIECVLDREINNKNMIKGIVTEAFIILSLDQNRLEEMIKEGRLTVIIQKLSEYDLMNNELKFCTEYLIYLANSIFEIVEGKNISIIDTIKGDEFQEETEWLIELECNDKIKEVIKNNQVELQLIKYCTFAEYTNIGGIQYLDYNITRRLLMVIDDVYRLTKGKYPDEKYIKKLLDGVCIDYKFKLSYRDIIKEIIEKPHLSRLLFSYEPRDDKYHMYNDVIYDSINEYRKEKCDKDVSIDGGLNNIKRSKISELDDRITILELFKYIYNNKNKQIKLKNSINNEELLISYKDEVTSKCIIYDVSKDISRVSRIKTQIESFNMLGEKVEQAAKASGLNIGEYKGYNRNKIKQLESELDEKLNFISKLIYELIEKNKLMYLGVVIEKEELIIGRINEKIKTNISNLESEEIIEVCLEKGLKFKRDTWVFIEQGIAYSEINERKILDENEIIDNISYQLGERILDIINSVIDEYIDDIRFVREYIDC